MTYSFTKPDRGPSPAIDVSQIRTNFSQFGSSFAANHTPLNDRNQGDHDNVIFEKQIAGPPVVEDLAVLFSKDATSSATTEPQLFVKIPKFLPTSQDTNNPATGNLAMQLTYNAVNIAGPVYQSFLPGSYLLYFGSVSGVSVPNVITILDVFLVPAPTTLLIAIATPNTMTNPGTSIPFNVLTKIITNSHFQIFSTANGGSPPLAYSFGWVAIAKA